MTFTATPQPANVPPRVRLDIDTDDPAKPFASLTIKRDGKLIREQPFIGGSTAITYDYEAPFGVPVTYTAEWTTNTLSTVYATAWPNLTGWSTSAGSPSVSGGRLVSGSVTRTASVGSSGRVSIAEPFSGVGVPTAAFLEFGGGALRVGISGTSRYVLFAGATKVVTHTSGALTVQWDGAGATITSPQGSWFIGGDIGATTNAIRAVVGVNAYVPGFTYSGITPSAPIAVDSVTTLSVDKTWLIHPSAPTLSRPIDHGPQTGSRALRFIEASSGESKSSAAQSTIHRPVGRRRAVVITSGPRQADEWTLVVGAPTIAGKNDIRALVDDQTPLLLRSPAGSLNDLPDDWYSVGDVTVQRVESPVLIDETLITLPLTPVDEPIVRQGALWTWGGALLAYPTWADLKTTNATWLDLLAGPAS